METQFQLHTAKFALFKSQLNIKRKDISCVSECVPQLFKRETKPGEDTVHVSLISRAWKGQMKDEKELT